MAGNVSISTGLRNQLLGNKSIRDILRGGYLDVRSGPAPATADAAVTGIQLVKIVRASLTSKVAQVMRITPTAGTAAAAVWNVTVNGDQVSFTDDGTPLATEICTGLTNLLDVLGGGAITTPAGTIQTDKCSARFTVTNNGSTIDITSSVAGVPIDVSSSVSGAGAGTGTLITTTQTEDAYGISLEAYSDVASGIVEKLATEVWSGVAVATGTAGYVRYVADGDTGVLSTSKPRIQGVVSTSNAPFIISSVNVVLGTTQTMDTFQITFPAV